MEEAKSHPLGKFTREDCPNWLLIDGVPKTKKAEYPVRRIKEAERVGPALPHLIVFQGKNYEGYTSFAKAIGYATRAGAMKVARRGHIGPDKIEIIKRG